MPASLPPSHLWQPSLSLRSHRDCVIVLLLPIPSTLQFATCSLKPQRLNLKALCITPLCSGSAVLPHFKCGTYLLESHKEWILPAHLPQGILLLGKDFKVLFCKLDRGQCLQAKVGPALHKLDQALKSVQSQTVIPVVGQVGHEDADLKTGKTWDTGKQVTVLFPPSSIPLSARGYSQLRLPRLSGLMNVHLPVYSTAVMKNERNVALARQVELQRGWTHTSHHSHTIPLGY